MGYQDPSEPTYRRILMRRGIMMGDPLTKVTLHLLNISVRILSENVSNVTFYNRATDNGADIRQAVESAITARSNRSKQRRFGLP